MLDKAKAPAAGEDHDEGVTKTCDRDEAYKTPAQRKLNNAVCVFSKKKPNERHWYAYDVALDGEFLITDSRDPEHDLARALLARGIRGVIEVIDGKTGKLRSRVNTEKAAEWCVGSNLERYRWKPPQASDSSPPAGETDTGDTRAPLPSHAGRA